MQLTINGQAKSIQRASTLTDIVGQFCKNSKNIMTELNGTIIPSAQWAQTPIKDGDSIELVAFVGGG